MSLFDTLKQIYTGRPPTLTGPVFIRESDCARQQLDALRALRGIVPQHSADQLEQDIRMLQSGISGEDTVAFELRNSFLPLLILRDLHLHYGDLSAQIDFVVIATRYLLVIECKKMMDDIEITPTGDFVRCRKSADTTTFTKEGIYSPVAQNQRHTDLIRRILCSQNPQLTPQRCDRFLRSIVVLANPKTVIHDRKAPAEIKQCIIKHDQLIRYMKALPDTNRKGPWFPEQGMYDIAKMLLDFHVEERPDYTKKYGVLSPKIPPLCPVCGVPMVLRIAQKGANAGTAFYGCANYPKCHQTAAY